MVYLGAIHNGYHILRNACITKSCWQSGENDRN